MFYVYVLQSEPNGRFYIGSTKEAATRVIQHNSGRTPSTKAYRPWKLVYSETYGSLVEARRRENEIKSWKSHYRICQTFDIKP